MSDMKIGSKVVLLSRKFASLVSQGSIGELYYPIDRFPAANDWNVNFGDNRLCILTTDQFRLATPAEIKQGFVNPDCRCHDCLNYNFCAKQISLPDEEDCPK